MLLQDYQVLGGIFTPKQILNCNETKGVVVMRGILSLNDKDYYTTVLFRRGRLARITKVAGESFEDAVNNKRELNRIRAEGICRNEGDLRSFVWTRAVRTVAWCVLMLSLTIGFSLCLTYSILHGIRGIVLLFGILFFIAMQLCRKYRLRIISAYPGIAFFAGGS